MAVKPIEITGLRELVRDLRKIDKKLPNVVKEASNVAARLVVDFAVPKVPLGPAKGGHAVSTVKAASTRLAARVAGGSKKYPYYAWLDFGGQTGRPGTPKRPFFKRGRFIWAGYAENHDRIEETLRDALMRALESAGLEPEVT